jgi:hypothetical protein
LDFIARQFKKLCHKLIIIAEMNRSKKLGKRKISDDDYIIYEEFDESIDPLELFMQNLAANRKEQKIDILQPSAVASSGGVLSQTATTAPTRSSSDSPIVEEDFQSCTEKSPIPVVKVEKTEQVKLKDVKIESTHSSVDEDEISSAEVVFHADDVASIADSSSTDDYEIHSKKIPTTRTWLKGRLCPPFSSILEPGKITREKLTKKKHPALVDKSSASPDLSPVGFRKATLLDIDDDFNTPIIAYASGQGVTFDKAIHFFRTRTTIDYKGNNECANILEVRKTSADSVQSFADKFWNAVSDNDGDTHAAVPFLKELFDPNLNVTKLLGDDFEANFLVSSSTYSGTVSFYEADLSMPRANSTKGIRSVRAALSVNDFEGLQNNRLSSSCVQYVSGKVFEKLTEELFKDVHQQDTYQIPSEALLHSMRTYNIIDEAEQTAFQPKKQTVTDKRVLEFGQFVEHNTSSQLVQIPEDVKYLVCSFQKPDWYGAGNGHAAFLRVNLEDKSIIGYDSLHFSLDECYVALQMFIYQYALRHPLKHFDPNSDFHWIISDVSEESLKQVGNTDCTMWSIYMMFCHYFSLVPRVYLLPETDGKYPLEGAKLQWSGCGLMNQDVTVFKNPEGYGTQGAFMDRFRLIIAYLLSHLSKGDNAGLGVPPLDKIIFDFQDATIRSDEQVII